MRCVPPWHQRKGRGSLPDEIWRFVVTVGPGGMNGESQVNCPAARPLLALRGGVVMDVTGGRIGLEAAETSEKLFSNGFGSSSNLVALGNAT